MFSTSQKNGFLDYLSELCLIIADRNNHKHNIDSACCYAMQQLKTVTARFLFNRFNEQMLIDEDMPDYTVTSIAINRPCFQNAITKTKAFSLIKPIVVLRTNC